MAMLESKGSLKTEKHNKSINDKKATVERLLVHCDEETLRRVEALHHCEDPLHHSEPESLKSKAMGPPLRSHLRCGEARFPFHYGNLKKTLAFWAIDGPTSRGIKRE